MKSMLHRVLMLAAALAAAGCNELIGAGEPEVVGEEEAAPDKDGESGSEPEPLCGNGVVDPGEECDDGNDAQVDGCDGCVISCGPAPEFFNFATDKCYRLDEESLTSWDDASAACKAWGGELAVPSNVDELAAIQQRVRKNTWIGGFDASGDGKFEWVTGEPWIISLWAGKPPAASGEPTCLLIEGEMLTVRAEPCATPSAFVCEQLANQVDE